MTKHKLQNIVLPNFLICNETEMYYKTKGKAGRIVFFNEQKKSLEFEKYAVAEFNTYFNCLSLSKWRKYTKADHFFLQLNLDGLFRITVNAHRLYDEEVITEIVKIRRVEVTDWISLNIPISGKDQRLLSFRLESLDDKGVFLGGEWVTEIEDCELNQIKIGLGICTYRREKYIRRNIQLLENMIENNESSDLKDNLIIYIADNGKTLEQTEFSSGKVKLFPNINAGGAGGFTRCIIEMKKEQDFTGLTHCLLSDDDVLFEPESIIRTYNLLVLAKKEYSDMFIGGSMLRLDKRNIMHESGALWNGDRFIPKKHNLNLNKESDVLVFDIEEKIQYLSWWFNCFPLSVCRDDNLPLPLFIRFDDIDFCFRNMKHPVILNGICVWHEPFEWKHDGALEYYFMRNYLIFNSIHSDKYSAFKLLKHLLSKITRNILYYKYKDCELVFMAVKDYLRGMDWLVSMNPDEHHKNINKKKYHKKPIEHLNFSFNLNRYFNSLEENDGGLKKLFRLLSFNGYFLKTRRDNIVSVSILKNKLKPINFYRARRVLHYDINTQTGYVTRKSIMKMVSIYFKFLFISIRILSGYKNIIGDYRRKYVDVTNLNFWKEYLELE